MCLWFPAGRLHGRPSHGGAIANGHAEDGVAAAGRDAPDGDGGNAAGGRLALLGAEQGSHRRAASCV